MYRIFLTNEFLKQLKKIDSRIRKGLEKKIEEYISPQLKQEPHFGKNVKKLRGYEPETWRYRIGSFRLFYIIDEVEKIVALISIDDRKNAYWK
jgi:mRNA interferase RelE/StbE